MVIIRKEVRFYRRHSHILNEAVAQYIFIGQKVVSELSDGEHPCLIQHPFN